MKNNLDLILDALGEAAEVSRDLQNVCEELENDLARAHEEIADLRDLLAARGA